MSQVTYAEATDSAWKGLYKVGGAAALIAAVLFRRNLGAEFSLLRMTGLIGIGPAMAPSSAIALPQSISAVFLLIWYILIARRLFQIGSGGWDEEVQ